MLAWMAVRNVADGTRRATSTRKKVTQQGSKVLVHVPVDALTVIWKFNQFKA
jgi:hypothetical protein